MTNLELNPISYVISGDHFAKIVYFLQKFRQPYSYLATWVHQLFVNTE